MCLCLPYNFSDEWERIYLEQRMSDHKQNVVNIKTLTHAESEHIFYSIPLPLFDSYCAPCGLCLYIGIISNILEVPGCAGCKKEGCIDAEALEEV